MGFHKGAMKMKVVKREVFKEIKNKGVRMLLTLECGHNIEAGAAQSNRNGKKVCPYCTAKKKAIAPPIKIVAVDKPKDDLLTRVLEVVEKLNDRVEKQDAAISQLRAANTSVIPATTQQLDKLRNAVYNLEDKRSFDLARTNYLYSKLGAVFPDGATHNEYWKRFYSQMLKDSRTDRELDDALVEREEAAYVETPPLYGDRP